MTRFLTNLFRTTKNLRGNRFSPTRDRRVRLQFESLEERTLLSANYALQFGGNDGYVYPTGASNIFDMGKSDFTLEAWIKGDPTMSDNWGGVLGKGGEDGYHLGRYSNTNKMGFEFLGSDSQFTTKTDVIDNTWHHITAVKVGNAAKLYVDGVLENAESGLSTAAQSNPGLFLIGYNAAFGSHWKGQIDSVRVWTVARSASDIANDMTHAVDPTTPGLAADWEFDEGQGTVAHDATAAHGDLQFSSSASDVTWVVHNTVVPPPVSTNYALQFSGDGWLTGGSILNMGTSDFTLEAWVKGDPTMHSWGQILGKGYGYELSRCSNTNKVSFEFLGSDSQFTTKTDVIDNTWHHIAAVKAGATARLFVDGVLENTETGLSTAAQSTSETFEIGFNDVGKWWTWKGQIDSVRVWTVARTASDIAGDMTHAVDPSTPGLAADWEFDEGQGTVAHDATSAHRDLQFSSSASGNVTWVVHNTAVLASTTTAVSASVNPAVFGQAVTFTATVSATTPGANTPTGTVTFYDGSTVLGTATLSSGTATLTLSSLSVGSHVITGAYAGDSNFSTSTSTALTETVNQAATTAALTSSASTAGFGKAVTFTATVNTTSPGSGTPTGTVTFKDGSTVLGTATLVNGTATFTTSTLSVGSHAITVVYGGDTNFATSTSSALTETIKAVPPAAPTGLNWSLVSGNTIQLSWSPVAGADGYRIYYWDAFTDDFELYKDVGTNVTSLTINNGYGLYFMVGAYNSVLENFSGWIFAGNP